VGDESKRSIPAEKYFSMPYITAELISPICEECTNSIEGMSMKLYIGNFRDSNTLLYSTD
jgi:hypothetical protein